MFKFLRSKAKIFYWVIAASFILFIFLAWGMDIRGSRQGKAMRSDVLGTVNGYPITAREMESAYQSQLNQIRQQSPDRAITPNQFARTRTQVWDGLVRERILESEIQRLQLTATDAEILDILKNDPPPALLANYTDENGNPDLATYMADLSDPSRDWSGVENYLRILIPRQKLLQLVVSGAVVTNAELQEAFLRQHSRAVAEYMGVLYENIESEYEPSEEEVVAYLESHAGLYQQPAEVKLQAVSWAMEPSASDRQEVIDLVLEIKDEIESGVYDFAEAAAIYSQDGTSETGGDLGTFDRNRMVAPFTEVAFSQPVGQISDPVETDFGIHLIEVIEQVVEDDEVTKVHARHILMKLEPGPDTLNDIYAAAEEFMRTTTAATFVDEATADSLDILSPDPVAEGRDIPGLRNTLEGTLYAHRSEPGTISHIFQNDEIFYCVMIEEKIPAGVAPLEEVRVQIVAQLQESNNHRLAREKLGPAVGSVQMGKNFEAAAEEFGLVHAITDTFTASGNIPDVGYGTAFNTVALAVGIGELVPEVETGRGLFALRAIWQQPFTQEEFAVQKESLRAMLLNRKQRELEEAWYQDLLASADIVDNRDAMRQGT